MKTLIPVTLYLLAASAAAAQTNAEQDTLGASQSAVHGQELMINGFRSPSIGLEYRLGPVSIHGGAYPTIINEGETAADGTTWFAKFGVTAWFLPLRLFGHERSAFYAGAAYLNPINEPAWGHGVQAEAGFRLVLIAGLFLRLGASALYAPGRSCATGDCELVKLRPNPGIGWALAID